MAKNMTEPTPHRWLQPAVAVQSPIAICPDRWHLQPATLSKDFISIEYTI